MMGLLRAGLWLWVCLWLSGCASTPQHTAPKAVQGTFQLTLSAHSQLNPNAQQQPQPVVVRVYQLTSPLAFYQADFATLLRQDAKTLGGEWVQVDMLPPLAPSETRQVTIHLHPRTRFIGVYAEFTQFRTAHYKRVLDLTAPEASKKHWRLGVRGNRWGEG